MPRNISAASLAKLAQNLGSEPINIIEIQWVDGGQRYSYSDRDIATGIHGKIVELGGMDNVVQTSGGSSSQQINVTLDDVDGEIKDIIDNHDIHQRPCWVYQWFDGLDTSEKFLLFKGQINTPISWKEGDRTVSLTILSKIEDVEVGFSIEEGDFLAPPKDLIGKPWPLCFGTVINVPALPLTTPRQGILGTGIGIADYTLQARIDATKKLLCPTEFKGYEGVYDFGSNNGTGPGLGTTGGITITPLYGEESTCAENRCNSLATLEAEQAAQLQYQGNSFVVLDGELFPQGIEITLEINGAQFTGVFTGELFTIHRRVHPNLVHPPVTGGIDVIVEPGSCNDVSDPPLINAKPQIGPTKQEIADSQKALQDLPTASFFWINPGARVTMATEQEIIYVANILPSTIIRVAAYREDASGRRLVTVPPEFYTIRQVDYTGYQVMEIVFTLPLSLRGVGWTDDVYVTLTSSVGPNTVDVLTWFIQKYTSYGIDSTSFDHVKALIDNYPSHFMLPSRMNIVDALSSIAHQARCAIWLADDVFYLRYLPETPTAVDTVAVSDIQAKSLELTHTRSEDIVTKYVATWREDYSVTDSNKIIYRHNVAKYGTHEETEDYWIYNIIDLVRKSATFWLIRKANTWRRVAFKTQLNKLNLEVFDGVTLNLPHLSDSPITALVETASFDSANNEINFECWTPLRSGERTPYDFSWPQDISETLIFPTLDERAAGFAGGGTGPNFIVKPPPSHPMSANGNFNSRLTSGFALACNGGPVKRVYGSEIECHEDFGLRKPSDRGDTKPSPKAVTDNSDVQGGANPLSTVTNDNNCCQQALDLAQKALAEARNAQANEANNGAGNGQPGEEDLPSKDALKKRGKCVYTVKVTYIIPTLVHGPKVYPRVNGSDIGDQGFVSISTPAGSETRGFNSEAAANTYFDSVQKEIDTLNNEGNYTVGKKDKFEVFKNYGPGSTLGDFGTTSCTKDSSPEAKQISFDKGT